MKGKLRITLSLALALLLALCLLTACGDTGSDKASDSGGDLADDDGVVGLWESEDWGGICIELLDDGTGTIYTYSDAAGITYEWDGKTLNITGEDDSETTGELQEDGSIGIMGLGYFYKVEERSYGPDMGGSSWTETGGMESELEGDWIHSSSNLMLSFDGRASVTFQDMTDGGGYAGSGWYSYDGETVTVDLSEGIFEGYIDRDGDLIIEIRGEGGWYSRGDSSELRYPDVTGPEAELVGYWKNDSTGDYIEFCSDGSVVYSIDGGIGFSSPFTFDGETVTFGRFTGYMDSIGDIVLDGVDHWFSLSEQEEEDGDEDYDDGYDDDGYTLGGAYDNDDAEMSMVFYTDGTATVSDFYSSESATYTVDGDYLVVEFDSGGYYEAYYDSSDDTFQVDGLDGWFYYVGDAWYTPD